MNINKECLSLIPYKNKIFLNPILSVENKLLAPLIYNKYIFKQIENIQYILSRFSNSNLVKLWLFDRLEQDKIIINAKIDEDSLPYKIIFMFNEYNQILKYDKLNKLYGGCYILDINKQYYIGSTSNFNYRFKSHSKHVEDFMYYKSENSSSTASLSGSRYKNIQLNEIQKFFLLKDEKISNFNANILYLNINYLNLFKFIYPNYKLNKGELILLKIITDFINKFLEQSLLHKFHPFLNMADYAIFKHFEWNDEFLDYNSRNNNVFECFKNKKYEIFIITELNKEEYNYDLLLNKYYFHTYKCQSKVAISNGYLQDICYKYNLKYYEVIANLNKFHHYESTILKNPLKIVEQTPHILLI